mmetsp:Transcript_58284/g.155771  ORF Transcript_58284/g.155771 Transcript_58284/m.155771 type:complete len:358 (+) Transcript_58284:1424-2497(+)
MAEDFGGGPHGNAELHLQPQWSPDHHRDHPGNGNPDSRAHHALRDLLRAVAPLGEVLLLGVHPELQEDVLHAGDHEVRGLNGLGALLLQQLPQLIPKPVHAPPHPVRAQARHRIPHLRHVTLHLLQGRPQLGAQGLHGLPGLVEVAGPLVVHQGKLLLHGLHQGTACPVHQLLQAVQPGGRAGVRGLELLPQLMEGLRDLPLGSVGFRPHGLEPLIHCAALEDAVVGVGLQQAVEILHRLLVRIPRRPQLLGELVGGLLQPGEQLVLEPVRPAEQLRPHFFHVVPLGLDLRGAGVRGAIHLLDRGIEAGQGGLQLLELTGELAQRGVHLGLELLQVLNLLRLGGLALLASQDTLLQR